MINVEEKGRGVSAEKDFKKGEVICEYPGELISHSEGITHVQTQCKMVHGLICTILRSQRAEARVCNANTQDNCSYHSFSKMA